MHKLLFATALALTLSFPFSAQVQAQSRSLSIMPPKFELFANQGDTVTEKIRVKSNADVPISYYVSIEDFSSAGEDGAVVLEEEGNDNAYSLARWIQPDVTQLTLEPGQEQTVNFVINVPRDAEPGGHYASILFQSSDPQVEGGASVSQRIGSLVLLRVSGNTVEEAKIETFTAPKRSTSGPVDFTLRIINDGNVHIRPKGTIVITNMFGRKVEELPLEGANVLPGATRKMDTTWEKEGLFGAYTATIVATYGQQNLPLTSATRFTVVSNTALIILAIAGVALIVFIISLFSGRGRLKKAFKALSEG